MRLWFSKAFRTWRPSAKNTTNGTRSKSTERTAKVASNGIICLAFEVCWSRGPDGIRCSDDLGNIWEDIRSLVSTLRVDRFFQCCTDWELRIVDYEQGALDVRWGYVTDEEVQQARNDTAYKRWRCHSGHKLLCKLCRSLLPPAMAGSLDGWRCSSQKRIMSRLIQVRLLQTNKSGFTISAINKYMLGSRYPWCATGLNTGCTSDAQVFAKHNTQLPGSAIYTDNPDSQFTPT